MDTSWMYLKDRTSSQFTKGVELFLDSIFSYLRPGSFKKCPCVRCGGRFYNNRDTMKDDIIVGGFMENYLPWLLMHNFETQQDNDQNEEVTINIKRDDIVGMVQDAMGIPNVLESADVDEGMMDDETKKLLIDELKDLWHDRVSTYDASSKKTVYKKEDVFKKRKIEELEIKNERERKAALRSEKRKMKEKMKGKGKMNVKVKQQATNSNEKEGNEHERQDNWKKKSIFFELVYWDFLPIRHNLDVMHIEKNVCDNVLFTLLGIAGKRKDHLNARLDLKELNIRPSLHP
ncbi:transposon, En/Spm-like protein [Tanacetum coccineum]